MRQENLKYIRPGKMLRKGDKTYYAAGFVEDGKFKAVKKKDYREYVRLLGKSGRSIEEQQAIDSLVVELPVKGVSSAESVRIRKIVDLNGIRHYVDAFEIPDFSKIQLSEGRTGKVVNLDVCHFMINGRTYHADEWAEIELRNHRTTLPVKDKDVIMKYFIIRVFDVDDQTTNSVVGRGWRLPLKEEALNYAYDCKKCFSRPVVEDVFETKWNYVKETYGEQMISELPIFK